MSITATSPRVLRRTPQHLAQHNRERALDELTGFHERGVIDELELERRLAHLEAARSTAELGPLLDDLRAGRRGSRERRASDDDRAAARRRLELLRLDGQLSDAQHERRTALADGARTLAEITEALPELPGLKARHQPRAERLASDHDRDAAIKRLNRELVDGRLTIDEYRMRGGVVRAARTREEIQTVYGGLAAHDLRRQAEAVAKVAAGVARGGTRILTARILFARAMVATLIIIGWQLTKIGATVPGGLLACVTLGCAFVLLPPRLARRRRER